MRLAVREAAAHRRAHSRCVVGVDDVQVEREVEERGAGRVRDGLPHAGLDPDPIDLAHREDLRVERAQELPLPVVERADADERELPRLDRG